MVIWQGLFVQFLSMNLFRYYDFLQIKKEILDKINYSLYLCRPIYIVIRIGKAW